MNFDNVIYDISLRPMRCQFCSVRFKYESVLIDHEYRLHKEEMQKADEKMKIQQIISFLESEETNFDEFQKSGSHQQKSLKLSK